MPLQPSVLAAQDGELVAEHDDFQFLELARPAAQEDELQDALKGDITH
jgi:hypothetical protein